MFRFVHLADVHLDTRYAGRDAESRQALVESCWSAFEGALDWCLAEQAHALVIAGDLFDGQRLSVATEGRLVRLLEQFTASGTPVIIASGNHDPGESELLSRIPWPDRVHVARNEAPLTVDVLDEAGEVRGKITAVGHRNAAIGDNLATQFPLRDRQVPHVAVLHAWVEGTRARSNHDRYAPCGRQDLESREFDYWALGHVHQRQSVLDSGRAWYPGNLQGRSVREIGAKGALMVEVPGPGMAPLVRFQPLARARFEVIDLADFDWTRGAAGVADAVGRELEKRVIQDPGVQDTRWYLRVRFTGRSELAERLPRLFDQRQDFLEELSAEVRRQQGLEQIDWDVSELRRPIEPWAHRDQPHVLGESLRLLEEIRQGGELPEELATAEWLQNSALSREQVLDLLTNVEEELVERLVREEREAMR